jgi:hypothetical protein
MTVVRSSLIFNSLLLLLIALIAWPVFVAVGSALSMWIGEGSALDAWALIPKRQLLLEFLEGYKASALFTGALGALAVVDYQLLSRHRLTWLIAGISLPIACIGIAFYFYRDPIPLLPVFAITGLVLFVFYRLADLLRRVY